MFHVFFISPLVKPWLQSIHIKYDYIFVPFLLHRSIDQANLVLFSDILKFYILLAINMCKI